MLAKVILLSGLRESQDSDPSQDPDLDEEVRSYRAPPLACALLPSGGMHMPPLLGLARDWVRERLESNRLTNSQTAAYSHFLSHTNPDDGSNPCASFAADAQVGAGGTGDDRLDLL